MKRWVGLVAVLAGLLQAANGQTNGIFADFSTSMGAFTVWLDSERAPRAVAGFVGLATGESGWLDAQSNVWHRPFYDGSIFHRIATNNLGDRLAIQGGGRPVFYMTTAYESGSVSTNIHLATLSTTNVAGIGTNVLVVACRTTNAPAVATNYVTGTNIVVTNAPTVTYASVATIVVSSNALGTVVTNTSMKYAGYTNFSLSAQVTTNYSQTAVVITNGANTNVICANFLEIEEVDSTYHVLRVEATNFTGPGYTMLEGVTNGLAHSNGVISMANSGPDTDGSQFFITTTNVPGWDGGYSVFGHVTAGMGAVTSIAAVAVHGTGSRPVEDVVLSNVVIRRVGAAAESFDVAAQGVPAPESAPVRIFSSGTNVALAVELANQTKPLMFSDATDAGPFSGWDHQAMFPGLSFYTNATTVLTQSWAVADLGDRHFFHVSRIRYPVPVTAPANNRASPGRKFTFWWDAATTTKYEVTFAASRTNQGTYQATVGTNAPVSGLVFTGDSWTQEAYSARLYFFDNSGKEQTYSLGFNPGQPTNRFTGTVKDWVGGATYSIWGTFIVQ